MKRVREIPRHDYCHCLAYNVQKEQMISAITGCISTVIVLIVHYLLYHSHRQIPKRSLRWRYRILKSKSNCTSCSLLSFLSQHQDGNFAHVTGRTLACVCSQTCLYGEHKAVSVRPHNGGLILWLLMTL